jgi:hypothetical protein
MSDNGHLANFAWLEGATLTMIGVRTPSAKRRDRKQQNARQNDAQRSRLALFRKTKETSPAIAVTMTHRA